MDKAENKIMKVAVYTRVSTKEQVDGYSLTYQESLCKEYAVKQGWEVVEIFQEQGESAKTADRTQLQKLLDYCLKNKGKVDIVLVHKLDRMSRVVSDYQAIRGVLVRYGIVLRSVSEPIDSSSTGKFMENIFNAVAQLDNDVRADRTKEGLKEKIRQGHWAWGAPLGYTNSPTGLIIDQERAPFVKKAFELYSSGNYTIKQISKMLAKWGVKTKTGGKVYPQTVTRMFEDKKYIGILYVKKWDMEAEALHEKLLSPELFYAVQRVRQGKANVTPMRLVNNPEFTLKNIAKCPSCSKYLTGSKSKGRTKRYAYYHCICGATRIGKERFEELFFEYLKLIQPNENFKRLFREVLVEVWEMKQRGVVVEMQKVDKELASLKELKTHLIEKSLQGVIQDLDCKEQLETLNARIAVKEIERGEIRSEEVNIDHLVSLSEELFSKVSTIRIEAPFEQRLKFQHLLFPKGIVYEDGIIRTAELGLPFKLNAQHEVKKSDLVPPAGVEPTTLSLEPICSIH